MTSINHLDKNGARVELRFSMEQTERMVQAIREQGRKIAVDQSCYTKNDHKIYCNIKYVTKCVELEFGEEDSLFQMLSFIKKEFEQVDLISMGFLAFY